MPVGLRLCRRAVRTLRQGVLLSTIWTSRRAEYAGGEIPDAVSGIAFEDRCRDSDGADVRVGSNLFDEGYRSRGGDAAGRVTFESGKRIGCGAHLHGRERQSRLRGETAGADAGAHWHQCVAPCLFQEREPENNPNGRRLRSGGEGASFQYDRAGRHRQDRKRGVWVRRPVWMGCRAHEERGRGRDTQERLHPFGHPLFQRRRHADDRECRAFRRGCEPDQPRRDDRVEGPRRSRRPR